MGGEGITTIEYTEQHLVVQPHMLKSYPEVVKVDACGLCGALVWDPYLHTEWHAGVKGSKDLPD